MPTSPTDGAGLIHEASIFTSEEMLLAYIAERLDRMIDHMISRASSRVGVFGSREHAFWLHEKIEGMRSLPLAAFIDRPDETRPTKEIGIPMLQIDDPGLGEVVDTILIADDRCEKGLHDLALRHVRPGITLFRLYHRLPIGEKPLGEHRLDSRRFEISRPGSTIEAKLGTLVGASSAEQRLNRLATAV